jgi:hypothetical protein
LERLTDRFDNEETVGLKDPTDKTNLVLIADYIDDAYAACMAHNAIERLAAYEDTGLTPEKIVHNSKAYDYWEREAKKYCSQLGEMQIKLGSK